MIAQDASLIAAARTPVATSALSRFDWDAAATTDAELRRLVSRASATMNIAWIGGNAPTGAHVIAEVTAPHADHRAPARAHQSADVVCAVDLDLGKQTSWPLMLDECLRLVAPGGLFVCRFSNTAAASVFAFKNLLAAWHGPFELAFEVARDDRSLIIGVTHRGACHRPATVEGVSFAVVTTGKPFERLQRVIDSIYAMTQVAGVPVEVLVCGPAELSSTLHDRWPAVRCVPEPAQFSEKGWITRKKNLLVSSATHDVVVVLHDRYEFRADFVEQLCAFGGDFDLLVPRQELPDGRRYPDWVALGSSWSWSTPGMLAYGEWSPNVYINGGLMIARTEVLRQVPWNEMLFWGQAEDVELTRRLQSAGYVPRFSRNTVAVSFATRPGTLDAFVTLPRYPGHFASGGPEGADAIRTQPAWSWDRRLSLEGSGAVLVAARHGVSLDGTWHVGSTGATLPAGQFGEVSGRIDMASDARAMIVMRFTDSVPLPEVMVNDVVVTPRAYGQSARAWAVPIGAALVEQRATCRIQLRWPAQDVTLVSVRLQDERGLWPRAATTHIVSASHGRSPQLQSLDAASLCHADAPLVIRGAQRIAVIVAGTLPHSIAAAPLLSALRRTVRPDATITLVGPAAAASLYEGFASLPVEWGRFAQDVAYQAECVAAFNRLDAQVAINLQSPRGVLSEILLLGSNALLVIGIDGEEYALPADQMQAIRQRYDMLAPQEANAFEQLERALKLDHAPPRLWPDVHSQALADALIKARGTDTGPLLTLVLDGPFDHGGIASHLSAGGSVLVIGAGAEPQLEDWRTRYADRIISLPHTVAAPVMLAAVARTEAIVGGAPATRSFLALSGVPFLA